MSRAYHTLAALERRLSNEVLVGLTNDSPDAAIVDEDVWSDERDRADIEIDAFLGARYAVPFNAGEVPETVANLSADLTTVRLYERRYPEGPPEGIKALGQRARELLRALATGVATLGVQPAPTQNSERTAQVSTVARVMTRSSLKVW